MMNNNNQVSDYANFTDSQSVNQTLPQSFETILGLIGFGKYQIYVFVIVGVIGMCDAGETQAISIVFPILEKEWGISSFQESLLGSLIYAGYLVGSIFSGYIADNLGRRLPMLVSSGIMLVLALLGAFMPNFVLYMIMRVLLVTNVGFIIPVAFSMLTENTPLKQRGAVLVLIGVFYTSGELMVCLLAYIFMPNLDSGNWRAVLAWAAVPAGIVLIICWLLLLESPRYYLVKRQPEEAMLSIQKISKINKKNIEEIQSIPLSAYQQISESLFTLEKQETGDEQYSTNYHKLLGGKFKRITPIVWYQWFVNTFVFAGITFLLPLTLEKLHKESDDKNQVFFRLDLKVITLSCLGEFPSVFIATVIVNIKYLGRKNSLALTYILVSVQTIFIFALNNEGYVFSLLVSGSKLCINLAFTISYEFTSELYPTYMRASGIGLASSVGRVGSIIMPWIVVYLNDLGTFISYGIFGVLAALAFLATLSLPFDTFNRELDQEVKI